GAAAGFRLAILILAAVGLGEAPARVDAGEGADSTARIRHRGAFSAWLGAAVAVFGAQEVSTGSDLQPEYTGRDADRVADAVRGGCTLILRAHAALYRERAPTERRQRLHQAGASAAAIGVRAAIRLGPDALGGVVHRERASLKPARR